MIPAAGFSRHGVSSYDVGFGLEDTCRFIVAGSVHKSMRPRGQARLEARANLAPSAYRLGEPDSGLSRGNDNLGYVFNYCGVGGGRFPYWAWWYSLDTGFLMFL